MRSAPAESLAGSRQGSSHLIDVAAARQAGVSPLPAVNERPDGVTEVIEYRPGGAPASPRSDASPTTSPPERQVDDHPARYRTWKSSLFSLNATNALLNLGQQRPASSRSCSHPRASVSWRTGSTRTSRSACTAGTTSPRSGEPGTSSTPSSCWSRGSRRPQELLAQLKDRRLYVQRIGRSGGKPTASARRRSSKRSGRWRTTPRPRATSGA